MSGLSSHMPTDGAQMTDPFLLSLLNHITLPPQVPQSVSSPNDLYMSNLGWSPQSNILPGQQYISGQYNPGSNSFNESSYINQAQLMGLNPAQPSSGIGNTDSRNNANRSPNMDSWNGYFGSS
jgi:hypothetical protein